MKKALLRLALALTAVFSLSSCATVLDHNLYDNMTQTRVTLDSNNFTVVKTVEGTSTAKYIFGIGGPGKENAIAELYKNAELSGSQKIIDISVVERYKTVLGVYNEVEYTAIGVVIEFTK